MQAFGKTAEKVLQNVGPGVIYDRLAEIFRGKIKIILPDESILCDSDDYQSFSWRGGSGDLKMFCLAFVLRLAFIGSTG
jgi:hypothetical protein